MSNGYERKGAVDYSSEIIIDPQSPSQIIFRFVKSEVEIKIKAKVTHIGLRVQFLVIDLRLRASWH